MAGEIYRCNGLIDQQPDVLNDYCQSCKYATMYPEQFEPLYYQSHDKNIAIEDPEDVKKIIEGINGVIRKDRHGMREPIPEFDEDAFYIKCPRMWDGPKKTPVAKVEKTTDY